MGICPFGQEWDFRKMISANKIDKFDHFLQNFFETVVKDIQTYNDNRQPGQPPVTQFSPIFDCTGFAYGQLLSFGGSPINQYDKLNF